MIFLPGARWQIAVDRLISEFRHQFFSFPFLYQARHIGIRIAEIAEMAGAGWAGGDTGGNPVFFRQGFVIDSVDTQRAFFHHACVGVVFPSAIRTGPGAPLAADAGIFVDEDDPVFLAFIGRASRANGYAGGFFAV